MLLGISKVTAFIGYPDMRKRERNYEEKSSVRGRPLVSNHATISCDSCMLSTEVTVRADVAMTSWLVTKVFQLGAEPVDPPPKNLGSCNFKYF